MYTICVLLVNWNFRSVGDMNDLVLEGSLITDGVTVIALDRDQTRLSTGPLDRGNIKLSEGRKLI